MMTTTTHRAFENELEDIYLEIKNLTKNIYIEQYVSVPKISLIKLQLLNLALSHASIQNSRRRLYCVTVGLVQLGLDLHEGVSNYKQITENGLRNQQLSILAGDYFSSKYYSLLAKNNLTKDTNMIAVGIRNNNIAKMKLYTEKDNYSIEEIINLFKYRESSLYVQFLDKFDDAKLKELWNYILTEMILFYYLLDQITAKSFNSNDFVFNLTNYLASKDEKKEINNSVSINEFNKKIKILYHKYEVKRKIEDIVFNLYNDLNNKIKNIENEFVQKELYKILNKSSKHLNFFNALEKI